MKIIQSNDGLKYHMDNIHSKYEENEIAKNLMEQMSKIFSRLYGNENTGQGGIKCDL